jgi:hypothetical protein
MGRFIIGCRLGSPGNDYIALAERVQALGRSWECPGNAWIVSTDLSAAEVRDELRPFLGPHDQLLVAELSGTVAWGGAGIAHGLRSVLG